MKQGLIYENGELCYYKNDELYHAGVIEHDGDIYYINSKGRAVKGEHIVHGTMANQILKRGTYTFGEDYKLVKGSYIPPRKRSVKKKKRSSSHRRHRKVLRKKDLKKIILIAAVLCLLVAVCVYLDRSDLFLPPAATEPTENAETVSLPEFTSEVYLCSDAAAELYRHNITVEDAVLTGSPYRAFRFEYEMTPHSGTLYISEHSDFSDCRVYPMPSNRNVVNVDNLKTGTVYYYKVQVQDREYTGSFTTARSTRFIHMEGAVNIRDIGGYLTQDGKLVRQGLLIRGSETDGLANTQYFVKEEVALRAQEIFHFVHDFDLRGGGTHLGPYRPVWGEDVTHTFYGAPQYGGVFTETYRDSLRMIFTDLADPSKYPMYMHCTWGTDRTGTIIFLLQGILNMSEADMIREFQMSGFVKNGYDDSHGMEILIRGFEGYTGDTLQEKILTFLKTDIGITDEQIQSIRDIFLEEP